MIGTEKQVKWAIAIKEVVIDLLEAKKETRGDLKDFIDIAIEEVEDMDNASYIIDNLKGVTIPRMSYNEKFEIVLNWMKDTEDEEFEGLIFGLKNKQNDLRDEYKEYYRKIKPKAVKPRTWIDEYDIVEIEIEDNYF